jgi:hypothetical protein
MASLLDEVIRNEQGEYKDSELAGKAKAYTGWAE